MLTTPRAQLIEKFITSPEGVVFKAIFLVYEEAGKVKARLIEATPVADVPETSEILAISDGSIASPFAEAFSEGFPLSTFNYQLNSLYFTGAKPRAPSN
jgi:hypothetical protein